MKKTAQNILFALYMLLGYQCHLEKPQEEADPIADFDFILEDNCVYNLKISFENKSINSDRIKWFFNYGKSNDSSNQSSPTFTYLNGGDYSVRLEVTNKLGVTDTKTKTLTVKAPITWDKTFAGNSVNHKTSAYSVQQTMDGGYITTGFTEVERGTGTTDDVVLIKTDAKGDLSWKKIYGGAKRAKGNAVRQTIDGGFIVVGGITPNNAVFEDIYLIKTNANGDTTWTKTYGELRDADVGYSVQQTKDGGYILVGETRLVNSDVFVIKTDTKGDTTWTKKIGSTNDDFAYSVQETSDGGFIVFGTTNTSDSGIFLNRYFPFLIKLTKNGDIQWKKSLDDIEGSSVGWSVQQTTDNGYILVGFSRTNNQGDIVLIKVNAEGIVSFQKRFGDSNLNEGGYSVKQLPNKGYIISGDIVNSQSLYLIKTDEKGELKWEKKIPSASRSRSEIGLTNDCGSIIATQGSDNKIHLIKLNKNGEF